MRDRPSRSEALASLASEADVARQPVSLLLSVGGHLCETGSGAGVPFLRRIQSAHPADFWANFALGDALVAARDTSAIGYYRAAVALRPDAAIAHINLGSILADAGRIDESIACLRRAVALDASSSAARNNLALSLLDRHLAAEAVEHATVAVQLAPQQPAMRGVLGRALMEVGRWTEAAAAVRRGLELCPESAPGLRAMLARDLAECEARLADPAAATTTGR